MEECVILWKGKEGVGWCSNNGDLVELIAIVEGLKTVMVLTLCNGGKL